MDFVIAILLATFVFLSTLRGRRMVDRLYKQSDQKLLDREIPKMLLRLWLIGALAVFVILALSTSNFIYQPFVQAPEYWQGFTLYTVLAIVLLLSAIVLYARLAFSVPQQKHRSIPLSEKLSMHTPGRRHYAVLLSLSAAINEELFFRAAVPLVFYLATNSVSVAIVASICLFALGHITQGVGGVISSAFGGILLLSLFVMTGNILVPMFVHFMVDIWALLIVPIIKDKYDPESYLSKS
jgi:membrane protease YdiL (CAAX protease family)